MPNTLEIVKTAMTAYNDKDWEKLKEVFAPDAVYDEKGTHRRLQGIGPVVEAWRGWAVAFPDSRGTFVREFTSGETAVLEVVWKGIHSGPLQMPSGTIPASSKTIELPACQIVEVKGDKITSFTHYFDMLTLLTQIGAAKA